MNQRQRTANETRMSVNIREEKEQPSKNTDKTRQIKENNGNKKPEKDGDNENDDESDGKVKR